MASKNPWKYLLSHHLPKEYNRCIILKFHNKKIRICSRCSGWYISFLLFWVLFFSGLNFFLNYKIIILYLFPIPAIIDWSLHRFKIYQGINLLRIITGFLIGLTFALLWYSFIINPLDVNFWIVSISYTIIAMIIFKITK